MSCIEQHKSDCVVMLFGVWLVTLSIFCGVLSLQTRRPIEMASRGPRPSDTLP